MAVRKVKVWNDHTKTHVENFKGDEITIPAKGFHVMEEPDAVAFLGQYTPVVRDGQGRDLKPKMLRLEVFQGEAAEVKKEIKCQACARVFETGTELDAHIASEHQSVMVDEEARKKIARKH